MIPAPIPAVRRLGRTAATLAAASVALVVVGVATASAERSPAESPVAACGGAAALSDAAGLAAPAVAGELDELSTFTAAVEASSLGGQLTGDGPITLLAPSNEAFEAIPANVFDAILADLQLLDSILGRHVVIGEALAPDALAAVGVVETLNGPVAVGIDGDAVQLNGGEAKVVCAGVVTPDLVVYVIDHVLQPASSPSPCPTDSSVPGSSVAGVSVPDVSVPDVSVPMSSVPGASVPGSSIPC